MLLLLENSCRIGGILRCGFKIEKGEGEKAIADNRGYVKQATAGFLGLLMALGAASAESKFLSLKPGAISCGPPIPGFLHSSGLGGNS